MHDKDFSEAGLYDFLDSAAKRGLLKPNTANSRKAAASKVLAVLEPDEKADLRRIDIEEVFHRFQNKQGHEYKTESLQVYLSRVKTAVSDFVRWRENPAAFKSASPARAQVRAVRAKESAPAQSVDSSAQSTNHQTNGHSTGITIPVPLRDGLTVLISNIPADLNRSEAERISAIVRAYSVIPEKPESCD